MRGRGWGSAERADNSAADRIAVNSSASPSADSMRREAPTKQKSDSTDLPAFMQLADFYNTKNDRLGASPDMKEPKMSVSLPAMMSTALCQLKLFMTHCRANCRRQSEREQDDTRAMAPRSMPPPR